ncbi:pectinesterase [uncultured Clostridium sp.]|uniref:pectinesterase n=1 Tax=uncultured Clostridium sp. TaxID=59620 RepID=UPI0032162628
MNNLEKQIRKFIKKGGTRIRLNIFIENLLVSLIVALGFCSMVSILGLFIPIYNLFEVCIIILTISMIIYISIYLYKFRPDDKKIALKLDSKGLDERLITSLELIDKEDNISNAQKEDTIEVIKKIKISKITSFHIKRKNLYRLIAVLTVLIMTICIPTTAKNQAREIRKIKKLNKEVMEKIKDEKKDTKSSKELLEEDKLDIVKELDKSVDEIKKSKSKIDTEKALNKLEKKLDNIEKNLDSVDSKNKIQNIMKNINLNKEQTSEKLAILNKMAKELSKIEKMKELSEAINSQDEEKIKEALDKLEEDLKNLKDEEKEAISSNLDNIAANISDENLKGVLSSTAASISSGNIDLSKLENALISLNMDSINADNGNSNNGTGAQNNQSGNGANGQGNGSGQGSGSGSGNGSGWDTGNKENGEGKLNSGEKVFLPNRATGNDDNLRGNISEDGDSQSITTENGVNIAGDSIDYEKIIHEYSNSEIVGLKNKPIPKSLQDLIKKYFEELK